MKTLTALTILLVGLFSAAQQTTATGSAQSSPQSSTTPPDNDLTALRVKAERGDAAAQFQLGLAYDEGHGVAQDYAEALAWYRKSAEQGYAFAQGNLGYMYQNGVGVVQNYEQAFASLRGAVHRDDHLEYVEPWAWMHPPRHALAALLAEQGHFTEAEQVYRDDLGLTHGIQRCAQHPCNVWALRGLMECLERRGETAEVALIRQRLEFAAARADVPVAVSCFCARGQAAAS